MKRIRIYLTKKYDADLIALHRFAKDFSISKAMHLAMTMVATGEFSYIALPKPFAVDENEIPSKDQFDVVFSDNDTTYQVFDEVRRRSGRKYINRSDYLKNLLRGVLSGPILSHLKDLPTYDMSFFNSPDKPLLSAKVTKKPQTRSDTINAIKQMATEKGLNLDDLIDALSSGSQAAKSEQSTESIRKEVKAEPGKPANSKSSASPVKKNTKKTKSVARQDAVTRNDGNSNSDPVPIPIPKPAVEEAESAPTPEPTPADTKSQTNLAKPTTETTAAETTADESFDIFSAYDNLIED